MVRDQLGLKGGTVTMERGGIVVRGGVVPGIKR